MLSWLYILGKERPASSNGFPFSLSSPGIFIPVFPSLFSASDGRHSLCVTLQRAGYAPAGRSPTEAQPDAHTRAAHTSARRPPNYTKSGFCPRSVNCRRQLDKSQVGFCTNWARGLRARGRAVGPRWRSFYAQPCAASARRAGGSSMLLTSGQKPPRRRSRGPLPIAKVCTLVQFLLTFLQTCGIVCIGTTDIR